MAKLFFLFTILMLTHICCNQTDKSETQKENELLKKEIELIKKEQELKDKSQQTISHNPTQQNKSDSWKTFNHKYGFAIDLPNYFYEGLLIGSALQYYNTDINSYISIAVETIVEASKEDLIKDYQAYLNSTEGIEYNVLQDNFFVISGKANEEIYYFKILLKNNRKYFLMIKYPEIQKDLFDKILPRISKSLR